MVRFDLHLDLLSSNVIMLLLRFPSTVEEQLFHRQWFTLLSRSLQPLKVVAYPLKSLEK